jgi:hypothetical protein
MPTRAPSACSHPRCVNPRPCALHPTRWAEGLRGRVMPPGWDTTRARILDRDGHTCRECGAPADEVHHTQPGCEADHLLVSLCRGCHLRHTQEQAADGRGASAYGWPDAGWMPAAPVTPGDHPRVVTGRSQSPNADGDLSPPATGGPALPPGPTSRPGWGVPPPRARAPGAVPVPARSAAGFGLFGSPQVTGTAVVAGQRPAPAWRPVAHGDRRPAESLTGCVQGSERAAEPVTQRRRGR